MQRIDIRPPAPQLDPTPTRSKNRSIGRTLARVVGRCLAAATVCGVALGLAGVVWVATVGTDQARVTAQEFANETLGINTFTDCGQVGTVRPGHDDWIYWYDGREFYSDEHDALCVSLGLGCSTLGNPVSYALSTAGGPEGRGWLVDGEFMSAVDHAKLCEMRGYQPYEGAYEPHYTPDTPLDRPTGPIGTPYVP